jgi:exonuclease SbcC
MSSLKLHSLDIRDFRGVRAASIDFHADVILIYGRNGTGKTTFFDAIEYALFGCNRRLELLAKRSDEKNWEQRLPNAHGDGSFDIGLRFQSGENIDVHRAADGVESGSWVGEINRLEFIYRRLLKDTTRGRRSVAAMHDLALSTHLLLQSEIAAFAASGSLGGDKLAALTGSGYIERCRGKAEEALKYARSQYRAGDVHLEELAQRRDEAFRRVNRIAASLARRDELLAAASSFVIYFPAAEELNVVADVTELPRMLSDVRGAAARAADDVGVAQALLESPQDADDEATLRASIETLRLLIGSTESQRATLAQRLASARKILDDSTGSLRARSRRHALAEKLFRDALHLREVREELPRLHAARDEATAAEAEASSLETRAREASEAASAALAQAVDAHERLSAQRSYIVAAAEAHASAIREEEQVDQTIAAARAELSSRTIDVEQARVTLRVARSAFDKELQRLTDVAPEVDRLAAELLALIRNESDCPLCGSHFGSPSSLAHSIARHAEERMATLDEFRLKFDERRKERDALEQSAAQAEAEVARIGERLAALQSNRIRVRARREKANAQLFDLTKEGVNVNQVLADLSSAVDAEALRVDEFRRTAIDMSAGLATAHLAVQSARSRRVASVSALEDAERRIGLLESEVRRAAGELGVAPEFVAIENLVSALGKELREADEKSTTDTAAVRELTGGLNRTLEDLAGAEARHATERRRLHEMVRRKEVREQQLLRLGLPVAASREDIDHAADAARERQTRLRELAGMISELVDIANSGTTVDFGLAKKELAKCESDVSRAQRELQALTVVGSTLNKWELALRKRVKAAVEDFVIPRAAEIENMFRSLVADPFRFQRIVIDPDATKGLRLGLVFRSLSESSGSPEFFLSAAQMSALALSIFLSLARSQTWSWLDTVLLDDPVQHLDDLDSIALLDGLRNVARRSPSKQLIISTCDRSLYHHMIRKFSMTSAPAESSLLAIRLEEDLAKGVRVHYEVDSRDQGGRPARAPAS